MSGMITTGTTSVSDYSSRTVAIEVTGICRQDVMKTSNYTVKVPYSRMSQTMQSIYRMGGKVANVTLLPAPAQPRQAQQSQSEGD
jgi:phycocyanin-associated, rod